MVAATSVINIEYHKIMIYTEMQFATTEFVAFHGIEMRRRSIPCVPRSVELDHEAT